MKAILFLTVCALTVLTSCKTTSFATKEKEAMDSWMGSQKSALILSWGPPTRTESDGNGGEILVYDKAINLGQTAGTVYNNGYGGVNYTSPTSNTVVRMRMFYVDSTGKIYHWRAEGRRG